MLKRISLCVGNASDAYEEGPAGDANEEGPPDDANEEGPATEEGATDGEGGTTAAPVVVY